MKLLVLALGNALCQDDGVGPAALAMLLRDHRPGVDAMALDGGTLGLSLLPLLEQAEAALLIDAVDTGDPAGTVVRLVDQDVERAASLRLSVHQIGVSDLLEGARLQNRLPPKLILWGIAAGSTELGIGLTPAVAGSMQRLVGSVLREAAALGCPFEPRPDNQRCAPDVLERALLDSLGPMGLKEADDVHGLRLR